MGKITLVLLLGMVSSSVWAAPARRPVDSLNDLPTRWEGEVGDLMTRYSGSLSIDRILRAERRDESGRFAAVYDVEASLSLGSRTVPVTKIDLSSSDRSQNVYWLVLSLKDELVPRLLAVVTYDEASDTYTLREETRYAGERRFVLKAKAPR
jgi:hypothetical protein